MQWVFLFIYLYVLNLAGRCDLKVKGSASLYARFRGLDWVRLVGSLRLGQLLQFEILTNPLHASCMFGESTDEPILKETQ